MDLKKLDNRIKDLRQAKRHWERRVQEDLHAFQRFLRCGRLEPRLYMEEWQIKMFKEGFQDLKTAFEKLCPAITMFRYAEDKLLDTLEERNEFLATHNDDSEAEQILTEEQKRLGDLVDQLKNAFDAAEESDAPTPTSETAYNTCDMKVPPFELRSLDI